MTGSLRDAVLEHDEIADLDPAARRLALRALAAREGCGVDEVARLADLIDGLGPLTPLLADDAVTDVLVNGPNEVWVERAGALELTDVSFDSRDDLWTLVERVMGEAGGRLDAGEPLASVRLPDGSRAHGVLPPVAPHGPLLSLRRHPRDMPSFEDLVRRSTVSPGHAALLRAAVRARRTVAVAGATGTGKTTLVNALLGLVDRGERVVTIEETAELRPASAHIVSLVARPPNLEGRGAVSLDRLVREALRMRPDRIVVGEVRGDEALAALVAMGTGHEGSLLTLHARSAEDTVARLAALAHRGAPGFSQGWLREEAARALDVVVFMTREGGLRRVAEVVEVR